MSKGFAAIVSLLLVTGAVNTAINFSTVRYETVTITEKERVANGKTAQYQVWTEKDGVYTVKDDLLQGKFNAADTYGQLKAGNAYKVKVNGFRVGLFSMFPNILEAEKVSK